MLVFKVDRTRFVLVLSLFGVACGGSSGDDNAIATPDATPGAPGADGSAGAIDGGPSNGADGASAIEAGPRAPLGAPHMGQATYYDADGTGNCSFDATPDDLFVAAMNMTDYAGSAVCGECAEVVGPKGTTTVRIVDSCPGCSVGSLDLSETAFSAISPLSAGRVAITWHVVPCDVSGPVAYRYKEGSSQYYTAIQVRNHRVPIATLEWKQNGAYVAIMRTTYDYFVVSSGVGPGALSLRVTSSDGQVLEDTIPAVVPAMTFPGAAQFQ